MAQFFISQGKKVIIAGRTESKLKDAAKELGSECAYYVLDTGDIPSIEAFAKRLIQEHPDIDCLVGLSIPSIDKGKSLMECFERSTMQEYNVHWTSTTLTSTRQTTK